MSNAIDDLDDELDDEPGDGEPGDDAETVIRDPDDYVKSRKLKALNDAKAHVRKVRNDRPGTATEQEWDEQNTRLAVAVASYAHELHPLLETAEDAGIIDENDYHVHDGRDEIDVRNFIFTDGRLKNDDGTSYEIPAAHRTMLVHRHLQRLERKLGLGLDLEKDENDEWEL